MKIFTKTIIPVFSVLFVMVLVSGCILKNDEPVVVEDPEDISTTTDQLKEDDWSNAETIYSPDDYDYTGWQTYTNEELGYSVKYPSDWNVVAYGSDELSKIVNIDPSDPEHFVKYLSISIERGNIDDIIELYTDSNHRFRAIDSNYKPMIVEKKYFAGEKIYYFVREGKWRDIEIVIPYSGTIYRIGTGRGNNEVVIMIISSFEFIK